MSEDITDECYTHYPTPLVQRDSLLIGVCQCLACLAHSLVVGVDLAALKVATVVLESELDLPPILVGLAYAVVGQALLVGVTT